MHHTSIRAFSPLACRIGVSHIRADSVYLSPLLLGQCFPQLIGCFCCTTRGQFENARSIDVVHYAHVVVSCDKAVVIDANVRRFVALGRGLFPSS